MGTNLNFTMPINGFNSGFINPTIPYSYTPKPSGTSNDNESFESYEKRTASEISNYFKNYAAAQKKEAETQEKEAQTAPLSKSERKQLQETILDNTAKQEHSGGIGPMLLMNSLFAGLFTVPGAIKTSDRITTMFYGDQAATQKLFKEYPDLMTDAQTAMRKLDSAYSKDIKRAKGDSKTIARIIKERNAIEKAMSDAIKKGDTSKIAELTSKAEFGKESINGYKSRYKRKLNGKNPIRSRSAAIKSAEKDGKIKLKTVKEGTSFLRNLGGKSCLINAGGFALFTLAGDGSKIYQAYEIDKKTGNDQLLQSSTKAAMGSVAFMGGEALGKTAIKKSMGKIAGKVATKVASKGAGKMLGAAIGSIVPGFGTIVGLVAGGLADWAIGKWVIPKLFKNDAVTEKTVGTLDDDKLLEQAKEQYMQGNDIGKNGLAILERKYNKETLDELKRVHNMTDSERAKYMETMQQQMQALQAAQTQGLNQTV